MAVNNTGAGRPHVLVCAPLSFSSDFDRGVLGHLKILPSSWSCKNLVPYPGLNSYVPFKKSNETFRGGGIYYRILPRIRNNKHDQPLCEVDRKCPLISNKHIRVWWQYYTLHLKKVTFSQVLQGALTEFFSIYIPDSSLFFSANVLCYHKST